MFASEQINYYKKLTELIAGGKLRIVSVVTIPRCRGTIFTRALGQAESVQGLCHEAFFPAPLYLKE